MRSNIPCSFIFSQELNALQRRYTTALINRVLFCMAHKQFASALRRDTIDAHARKNIHMKITIVQAQIISEKPTKQFSVVFFLQNIKLLWFVRN